MSKKIEIFSKVECGILLHVVLRASDFATGVRENVGAPAEALQVSMIGGRQGTSWRAHKHLPKPCPAEHVTQESWVVIAGGVEAVYYDLDDSELRRVALFAGDCSITYRGGHGYRVLPGSVGAHVYEFKTGPYFGQETDKVFVKESST